MAGKKRGKRKAGTVFRLFRMLVLGIGIAGAKPASSQGLDPVSAYRKGWNSTCSRQYVVKVVKVIDGDTVDVNFLGETPPDCRKSGQRVRLIGVDTPEYYKEEKQPYAEEAKDYTNGFWQRTMKLTLDPDTSYRDKYGRLLCYLTSREGVMLNYDLIRKGYGKYYGNFDFNRENMEAFRKAEKLAKREHAGLWGLEKEKVTDTGRNGSARNAEKNEGYER